MIIKFDYDNFLIMDGEKLLSISHHFFPGKNRIMLSVGVGQLTLQTASPTDAVYISLVSLRLIWAKYLPCMYSRGSKLYSSSNELKHSNTF